VKNKKKSFRQAALIIILIITYSSFSDCFYTLVSPSHHNNMFIDTPELPSNSPYVFYYHLPSMPLEETYANSMLKVPYRLITYRPGTITGTLPVLLADNFFSMLVMAVLLKRPAGDKPRLYSFLPPRGHGPPKERLTFSLS
jgi:hypothetical protein